MRSTATNEAVTFSKKENDNLKVRHTVLIKKKSELSSKQVNYDAHNHLTLLYAV
jgi:hypothetical protein